MPTTASSEALLLPSLYYLKTGTKTTLKGDCWEDSKICMHALKILNENCDWDSGAISDSVGTPFIYFYGLAARGVVYDNAPKCTSIHPNCGFYGNISIYAAMETYSIYNSGGVPPIF